MSNVYTENFMRYSLTSLTKFDKLKFQSTKEKKVAKAKKFRATANPAYIQGMRELRRSNASGTHADKRNKRARTRSAQLRRDLRDAA